MASDRQRQEEEEEEEEAEYRIRNKAGRPPIPLVHHLDSKLYRHIYRLALKCFIESGEDFWIGFPAFRRHEARLASFEDMLEQKFKSYIKSLEGRCEYCTDHGGVVMSMFAYMLLQHHKRIVQFIERCNHLEGYLNTRRDDGRGLWSSYVVY